MAALGHNNPPEDTPFEVIQSEIDDLYLEAKNWCDGEAVTTQGQADAIADLINLIRAKAKEADDLRKIEVRPHDFAKKAVQARFAPLIGNTKAVTGKTILALDACKQALAPWLIKLDEEKRKAEEEARRKAQKAEEEALEARRAADMTNLEDREAAEAMQRRADAAKRLQVKAEKEKASASSDIGRTVSLRDNWVAKVTNVREAVGHYWNTDRDEFEQLVQRLASRDARCGRRDVPGVVFENERKAV